ncbi:ATP-binding protein [Antarcticirhabdus aurantiaca]|uniref:ATP-binding protein n=1 Tax=Antarcticirhabdus aurantiaca TaxID=2606717 RepID=A0ACD4NX32_9HYPH|nr:ATP-binding protein [Antarcticirhabdus aurantiaca]WAJ31286.1 ATP-binding protein [Jeongeuplla avenae]
MEEHASDVFPGDVQTDADLAAFMDEASIRRAERMARINGRYLKTGRDRMIDAELQLLVEAAAVSADGRRTERNCLCLIGATGAGKSTSIDTAIRRRPELQPRETGMTVTAPIIRLKAPSPCSLKLLAEEALEKLGYPCDRPLKEGPAWKMLRRQLKARRVRFMHIDEAQHLVVMTDRAAMERVSDALKMLVDDDEWPVSVILTGLPELADFLAMHGQLRRRSHTIHLENLAMPRDLELLRWMTKTIVEDHAGMSFEFPLDDDFLGRLCRCADSQLGAVTQIVRGAIERVLVEDVDANVVGRRHFATSYAAFSGCRPDQNIVTARAWREIEPMNALLQEEELARVRVMKAIAERHAKHDGRRGRNREREI